MTDLKHHQFCHSSRFLGPPTSPADKTETSLPGAGVASGVDMAHLSEDLVEVETPPPPSSMHLEESGEEARPTVTFADKDGTKDLNMAPDDPVEMMHNKKGFIHAGAMSHTSAGVVDEIKIPKPSVAVPVGNKDLQPHTTEDVDDARKSCKESENNYGTPSKSARTNDDGDEQELAGMTPIHKGDPLHSNCLAGKQNPIQRPEFVLVDERESSRPNSSAVNEDGASQRNTAPDVEVEMPESTTASNSDQSEPHPAQDAPNENVYPLPIVGSAEFVGSKPISFSARENPRPQPSTSEEDDENPADFTTQFRPYVDHAESRRAITDIPRLREELSKLTFEWGALEEERKKFNQKIDELQMRTANMNDYDLHENCLSTSGIAGPARVGVGVVSSVLAKAILDVASLERGHYKHPRFYDFEHCGQQLQNHAERVEKMVQYVHQRNWEIKDLVDDMKRDLDEASCSGTSDDEQLARDREEASKRILVLASQSALMVLQAAPTFVFPLEKLFNEAVNRHLKKLPTPGRLSFYNETKNKRMKKMKRQLDLIASDTAETVVNMVATCSRINKEVNAAYQNALRNQSSSGDARIPVGDDRSVLVSEGPRDLSLWKKIWLFILGFFTNIRSTANDSRV